jgi:hypothetical protein
MGHKSSAIRLRTGEDVLRGIRQMDRAQFPVVDPGVVLSATAALSMAMLAMPLGMNMVDVTMLFIALTGQLLLGKGICRKLFCVHVSPLASVGLWFGIGSMTVAVGAYLVAALGHTPRVIMQTVLPLVGPLVVVIALAQVMRTPTVRRGRAAVETPTDVRTIQYSVFLVAVIIDWRFILALVALGVLDLLASQAPRLRPWWSSQVGVVRIVLPVPAVLVARQMFSDVGYVLSPREFAMASIDWDVWTSMGWGVLRHGPWEDVQKFATSFGYHNLGPTWSALTAVSAGIDVQVLTAQTTYIVAVLPVIGLFVALAQASNDAKSPLEGVRVILVVMAAIGSVSALEPRGTLDVLSLTQTLSVGWWASLLSVRRLARQSRIHAEIVWSVLFGSLVLAKTTTFVSAGLVLLCDFVLSSNRRQRRSDLRVGLLGFACGVALFGGFIFSARADAIYSKVSIQSPVGGKWVEFISDERFGFWFQVLNTLPVVILVATSVVVSRKASSSCSRAQPWVIAGGASIAMSLIVSFGDIGMGEVFLFCNGLFLMAAGAVAAIVRKGGGGVRDSETRCVLTNLVAGLKFQIGFALAGFVLGLGLLSLRLQQKSDVVSVVVPGLCLLAVAFVSLRWIRGRGGSERLLIAKRRRGRSFEIPAGLVLAAVLSIGSGNTIAYAFHRPLLTAAAVVRGDVSSSDLLAEIGESRERRLVSEEVVRSVRCLRESASVQETFASVGIGAAYLLGELQLRAYYLADYIPLFPEGSAIRATLEERVRAVAGAVQKSDPGAIRRLRADGVTYLILVRSLVATARGYEFEPHRCSNEELLILTVKP